MAVISLPDAMKVRPSPLLLPSRYRSLMGNIPRNEQWDCTIYGRWGSGKSTFSLQLADVLAKFGGGNILYCNSEEKIAAGTIQSRAKNSGVYSHNIFFTDTNKLSKLEKELETGFEKKPYKYCFIDSVNRIHTTPERDYMQIMALEDMFPKTSFIFILHSTKDKKTFRGPADFGFDTGIVLEAIPREHGSIIVIEKNRYGAEVREHEVKFNNRRKHAV